MPEGDTVWLAARRLHEALAGRRLERADLRVPRHATADLAGRRVIEVAARGKHMLTRLEPATTLHTHFRMDGFWRIARAGTPPRGAPPHELRVILANADWQALGYRLHDIALVATERESAIVGHLGPDILGGDWDPAEAVRRIAAVPGRAIGEALQDQRNLAGIGNLYETETLFLCGITPWTPVADVPDLSAIVDRAHALMRANRDHPEQSTTGDLRRGRSHWVYDRARLPCRRCGTPVRRARVGAAPYDRVAYWCPHCQRGLTPVDSPSAHPSSS